MLKLKNFAELADFREKCAAELNAQGKKILVCGGTGCIAGGALKIYEKLIKLLEEKSLKVSVSLEKHVDHPDVGVKRSGCNGFCEMGPLVRIEPYGWLYTKVKEEDCEEIIEKSILGGEFIERLAYKFNGEIYREQDEIPFYKKQSRVSLADCGHIDAEDIGEYIANGGYTALEKALTKMSAEDVIN